jgi:peptide deformylase
MVERPAEVTVAGVDRGGRPVRHRCAGLLARAVAHEVDHLAGRLYVDLVDPAGLVDVREHPTPPSIDPPGSSITSAEGTSR